MLRIINKIFINFLKKFFQQKFNGRKNIQKMLNFVPKIALIRLFFAKSIQQATLNLLRYFLIGFLISLLLII